MLEKKILENVAHSYNDFVSEFGVLRSFKIDTIEQEIGLVSELFSSQKRVDHAKKVLGKSAFNELLGVYFSAFKNTDAFDYKKLDTALTAQKKVFLRHLGRDKVNYLSLMIKIMRQLSESNGDSKKGLLFEAAS